MWNHVYFNIRNTCKQVITILVSNNILGKKEYIHICIFTFYIHAQTKCDGMLLTTDPKCIGVCHYLDTGVLRKTSGARIPTGI